MNCTTMAARDTAMLASRVAARHRQQRATRFQARWMKLEELTSLEDDWERLAQNTIWPNPSYEPNYLIPALKHLSNGQVRVLIVEAINGQSQRQLIGLLPIEFKRIYHLPFQGCQCWRHDHCFNSTPLLHRRFAKQAWKAIGEKLKSDGVKLFSLDTVAAEPAIESVFRQVESESGQLRFQRDRFKRAGFKPGPSAEEYVRAHVSKSIYKNAKRLGNKLAHLGQVEWELSNDRSDYQQLTDDFLRIESSGWKGEQGTALASNRATETFYRELIQRSTMAGKARFLSLKLDGKPIAMISDIRSGNVVYGFKTAYDRCFAKFSPGQQVHVKNLDMLHGEGIRLVDSCTSSDNNTLNRIWGQKITYQNIILSLTPGISRTALRSLPLAQSVVHKLKH